MRTSDSGVMPSIGGKATPLFASGGDHVQTSRSGSGGKLPPKPPQLVAGGFEDDGMFGPSDVARLLLVSRAKFFRMASRGEIPEPIRFGRSVRWPKSEIRRWIAARCPKRDKWREQRDQ